MSKNQLSSSQIKDLAQKGIVDGKPLKEWIDAPYGVFAEAVREKVDPFFGLASADDAPMRRYSVKVRYSYVPEPEVEYATKTYEIDAVTPELAAERAEELWDDDGDLEHGEDHQITKIGEPELIPQSKLTP